jgi:hypothetical protein
MVLECGHVRRNAVQVLQSALLSPESLRRYSLTEKISCLFAPQCPTSLRYLQAVAPILGSVRPEAQLVPRSAPPVVLQPALQ